jgi:hypothetical protein
MDMNTLPQVIPFEVESFKRITDQAPAMLELNEASKTRAIEFAGGLFASATEHGMSDALDEQLKNFVAKAKVTYKAMDERRKPFTQLVDAVKKRFTSQESDLKQVIDTAQKYRDDYATKKMNDRIEEEKKAKLKLAKEKEMIVLRQQAETQLSSWVARVIAENRQNALNLFNSLTLETIDGAVYELDGIDPIPSEDSLQPKISLSSSVANADEISAIIESVRKGFEEPFIERHSAEILLFIRELKDKVPSKRRELEAIAKADEAEKASIAAEQSKREEAEKASITADEEAERKEAEAAAAVRASAQTASAIVYSSASLFAATPDVKTGYRITVSSVAAYLIIAQFWFEKEGKKLPVEKIEKVTFERMRKFCEDYAIKNEEFIDNKMVRYEPTYKAK